MTLATTKERDFLAHYRIMRDALERIVEIARAPNKPAITFDAIADLAEAALARRVKEF